MNFNIDKDLKVAEPTLMPYQNQPFNGDTYVCEEFIRLKTLFNITHIVETGTCLGYTTKWFCENFKQVKTVEINNTYFNIAYENRLSAFENVEMFLGDSVDKLEYMLDENHKNTIVFLDAHWGDNCPLERELDIIASKNATPIIVIHDFKVPDNAELGYDSYNNQPFTYEWLEQKFINIYSKDKFDCYYNSMICGAQRGVIFLLPNTLKPK